MSFSLLYPRRVISKNLFCEKSSEQCSQISATEKNLKIWNTIKLFFRIRNFLLESGSSFCFLADFKKESMWGCSWHLFYTLGAEQLGCSIKNSAYNNLEVVNCGTVLFPAEHVIECTCHRIIFNLSWGKKHSGNLIENLIWNTTQYLRCFLYFFLMRT